MRNTPTHVGKTFLAPVILYPAQKHPHARGENQTWRNSRVLNTETPPRTWGKPDFRRALSDNGGNTPTHVGKTWPMLQTALHCGKHPHARGENGKGGDGQLVIEETPPRTWGKRFCGACRQYRNRNTPTHVGKTQRSRPGVRKMEKHPHARGENSPFLKVSSTIYETPPRTWGKL